MARKWFRELARKARSLNEIKLMQKMFIGYILFIVLPVMATSALYYYSVQDLLHTRYLNSLKEELSSLVNRFDNELTRVEKTREALQSDIHIRQFLSGYDSTAEEELYTYIKYIRPYVNYWNNVGGITGKMVVYRMNPGKIGFTDSVSEIGQIPIDDGQLAEIVRNGSAWINLSEHSFDYRYYSVIHSVGYMYTAGILEITLDIPEILQKLQNETSGELMLENFLPDQKTGGDMYGKVFRNYGKLGIVFSLTRPADKSNFFAFMPVPFLVISSLAFLMLFFGIYLHITRIVTKRIMQFSTHIKSDREGEKLTVFMPVKEYGDELDSLVQAFNSQVQRIDHLVNDVLMANLYQSKAEYKLLLSQVDPHFICNTLECIRMTAECNNDEQTSQMIFVLGRFIRRNLYDRSDETTLDKELECVYDYLELIKMRKEDAFSYEVAVECDITAIECPTLILQPLIENSVKYGRVDSLRIAVRIWKDDCVHITISDNGRGMDRAKIHQINTVLGDERILPTRDDNCGIGLISVDKRIKSYYGRTCGLLLEGGPDSGITAHIRLGMETIP